jgi:hypothetical protein
MKFDSKETENYFYEQVRNHRLLHVNANVDSIWNIDDVDKLIRILLKLNK